MSTTTDHIPESGFDPALFWQLHKSKIITYSLSLLVAIGAVISYQISANRNKAEAQALLANASKADDFRVIISRFPGSVPAGNATLLLAEQLRKEGKHEEALGLLRRFAELYPQHSLSSAASFAIAQVLETQGQKNQALEAYQSVTSRYANSFSAPLAMLSRANLLNSMGKTDEARRVYENLLAQYPDSFLTPEAREQLRQLK